MPCTRQELEGRERQFLAPFAQFSAETRGRKYAEEAPEWRTHYQRDRDRVIHSRAFRRLEYKTQVFLNGTGDHLRTRLTHTMEVASIIRRIAGALRLNEDVAEAIALAPDLGHSPFGHSGEEMLAECMREYGGFEHNRQSLRVVELLENPYPKVPGLNLTLEVREGLDKTQMSSLEAQIADLADEITYYSHDLDDAIDFDVLNFAQLEEVDVWKVAADSVRARYPDLRQPDLHKLIIRDVIDRQVQDVIVTSAEQITSLKGQSRDDIRNQPVLIRYGDELAKANRALRKFLYQNVYYHPRVAEVNQRACEMLRKVFESYLLDPGQLGDAAARRIESEGLHRTVCDYIAGMTDRYLTEEYARLGN